MSSPADGAMPELTRIETVIHLQNVGLFSFCTAEQVVRMASIARTRRVAEGERIYSIDDPAEYLYCLVSGQVELRGRDGSRRVEAPETFGAREILSDHPRSENATALDDTRLLLFAGDDFFDLLSNNIGIVKALFRRLLRPKDSSSDGTPVEIAGGASGVLPRPRSLGSPS